MADEQVIAAPAAEPEESLSEFIARENALLRGEVPAEPEAESQSEPDLDPEQPSPEPEPETTPAATPVTPKIDKRTKEGRKLSIQQEIDALTGQRHQAQKDLETSRAELAALRAERERLQAPPQSQPREDSRPAAPTGDDPEPQLNDFMKLPDGSANPDPYSAWVFAKARWISRQELAQHTQQQQAAAHHASAQERWNAGLAAIRERVPDIDQKLSVTPLDKRTWPYLQNHPEGPAIGEYLAEHLDEAQALQRLHPIEQIGRIGEIVGSIKASRSAAASVAQRKSPVVSAAKPPIKPLGTSPVAAPAEPGDDEPFSVFYARENKALGIRGVR